MSHTEMRLLTRLVERDRTRTSCLTWVLRHRRKNWCEGDTIGSKKSDYFLPCNFCQFPIILCPMSVTSSVHFSSSASPRLRVMGFSCPWNTVGEKDYWFKSNFNCLGGTLPSSVEVLHSILFLTHNGWTLDRTFSLKDICSFLIPSCY